MGKYDERYSQVRKREHIIIKEQNQRKEARKTSKQFSWWPAMHPRANVAGNNYQLQPTQQAKNH
jgi:hypothetical protein